MRIFFSLIIIAVVVTAANQLYRLQAKKVELEAEYAQFSAQVGDISKENKDLSEEMERLADPERMIREAKGQFNYAKPGEKLIIVTPKEQ